MPTTSWFGSYAGPIGDTVRSSKHWCQNIVSLFLMLYNCFMMLIAYDIIWYHTCLLRSVLPTRLSAVNFKFEPTMWSQHLLCPTLGLNSETVFVQKVPGAAEQWSQGRVATPLRIAPGRDSPRRGVSFSFSGRSVAQSRPERKRLAGRVVGRLSPSVQEAVEAGTPRHQLHHASIATLGRPEERQALFIQGQVTCPRPWTPR